MVAPYMLGQCFCVAVDVDEDVEVVDFADGLAVAACAIAAVPPTRAPETLRATIAFRSWCRIVIHLLSLVAVAKESTGIG